jgi:hypothetical protein
MRNSLQENPGRNDNVACRAVAMQRLGDVQIYQVSFRATARLNTFSQQQTRTQQ